MKTATTSEQRCRELAAAQENLIRRDQAIACGLTESAVDRRISGGHWARVLPRVYVLDRVAISWRRRVRAASLWAGEGSALSHRTAAALWQLDACAAETVVITTERSLKPPPEIDLRRARRLHPAEVATLDDMSIASPAKTLLDLAASEPHDAVEDYLDNALRCRLVSLAKLRWFVETHGGRGRPGTAVLRALLEARSPDLALPESPLERRAWNVLVRSTLPRPVRQHEIRDGRKLVARVDIAYPGARLAVEVDGYRWHSGRRAWSHDLARRNRLTALGWTVLHVTYEDITMHPRETIDQIGRLVDERMLSRNLRSAKGEGRGSA